MNIRDMWQSFYGEQVPISYLLRPQNKNVWFRIHSLPESKRYAQDEAEMQEVLRRHNIVAAEVLKPSAQCLLFFPEYALNRLSSRIPEVVASASRFCHYEDENSQITIWATQTIWEPHKFDSLLRLVANDEIRYVSCMNLESGEVFAPYDGGADLYLNSMQRRDSVKVRYSDWLSTHPEGV